MNPSVLLLVMVVVTGPAMVYGGQPAAGSPAAQFWDEALPDSPMPDAIADMVQEGIDHTKIMEHAISSKLPSEFLKIFPSSPANFLNSKYASSPTKFLNSRYASSTSKFLNRKYASSTSKFLNSKYDSSPTKFLNSKHDDSSPRNFLNSRYDSTPTKFPKSRYISSPTKFLNSRYVSTPTKFLNSRYDDSLPTKFLNSRYASSSSKFVNNDRLVDGRDNVVMPPAGLFFHQAEVRAGNIMNVSYPPTANYPILPHYVAEKMPFNNLKDVLATFNIMPDSMDAVTLNDTLHRCQASPNGEKQKTCTTSLESTVQSAMRMFGTTGRDVWVAASAIPRAGLPMQQYVVQKVTMLNGNRHVGCHDVPYPYAVYMCHMTVATKAYMVLLGGIHSGPPAVAMVALCHLDTKDWSPGHPAFDILHTQPGGAPLCHFLPHANLLFGEKAPKA